MKKVPKWCIIGFIISLIVFIVSLNLYTKQNDKDKEDLQLAKEKGIILEEKEYTIGRRPQKIKMTRAVINIEGLEHIVELSGHGYNVGEIIILYKYKDKYYDRIDKISFDKNPLVFWVMVVSIFTTFLFFPFQIIVNALSKNDRIE